MVNDLNINLKLYVNKLTL